eukprot:10095141-Heterocapsa_arctica.AAC.1
MPWRMPGCPCPRIRDIPSSPAVLHSCSEFMKLMASLRDKRTAPNLLKDLRSALDIYAMKALNLSIFSGM